ncbi:hypothetical protein PAXRUDRAFT_611511 [Paxillus rubicundulus Ve08.2h10]|uniref:Uncharacterized protein n=1 Tax=Paxillus rubicundulus Ve08.2h10 TaxID=930991 RepID=A0A0D0D5B8_9AGAM|nr:hypothetical protein PAXRUDRAFT_611511 [Paxillus rubicundulus Ve08.2h10]
MTEQCCPGAAYLQVLTGRKTDLWFYFSFPGITSKASRKRDMALHVLLYNAMSSLPPRIDLFVNIHRKNTETTPCSFYTSTKLSTPSPSTSCQVLHTPGVTCISNAKQYKANQASSFVRGNVSNSPSFRTKFFVLSSVDQINGGKSFLSGHKAPTDNVILRMLGTSGGNVGKAIS